MPIFAGIPDAALLVAGGYAGYKLFVSPDKKTSIALQEAKLEGDINIMSVATKKRETMKAEITVVGTPTLWFRLAKNNADFIPDFDKMSDTEKEKYLATNPEIGPMNTTDFQIEFVSFRCPDIYNGTRVWMLEIEAYNNYVSAFKACWDAGLVLLMVDASRTFSQQETLKKDKPTLAAAVGKSLHQYGMAVDIATGKKGELWIEAKPRIVPESPVDAALERFGFKRTNPSENWHYEHIANEKLKYVYEFVREFVDKKGYISSDSIVQNVLGPNWAAGRGKPQVVANAENTKGLDSRAKQAQDKLPVEGNLDDPFGGKNTTQTQGPQQDPSKLNLDELYKGVGVNPKTD